MNQWRTRVLALAQTNPTLTTSMLAPQNARMPKIRICTKYAYTP